MAEFTNSVCGGADVLRVIKFVFILLRIVNWIVPMALIVMISIDFAKNVMAGKEDDMKKNVSLVIKRIIFAMLLFLVMPIVEFVIGMLGDTAVSGDKSWLDCIDIATTEKDLTAYEINWNEINKPDSIDTPDKNKIDSELILSDVVNELLDDNEYTVPIGRAIEGLIYGPRYRIVPGETLKYNPETNKFHILNSDGSFGDASWSIDEISQLAKLVEFDNNKNNKNNKNNNNSGKKTGSVNSKTGLEKFLELRIQPSVWVYSDDYKALSDADKNKVINAYGEVVDFVSKNPISSEWKKTSGYKSLSDLAKKLLYTDFKSHKEQFCYELKRGGSYTVPEGITIGNTGGARSIVGGEVVEFNLDKGMAYVGANPSSFETGVGYKIDKLKNSTFSGSIVTEADQVSCDKYNK